MEPRAVSVANQEQFSIAVVDDDDIYRDFVTAVISVSDRFVTFDASNGTDLCKIIANQPIDCIVLDYNVGDESGFSIRQLLHDRFERIPPIVMLTGDDSQSTVINASRLGISDYVPKHDMKAEVLFSAIDRAIAKDREQHQAEAERRRSPALATRDGLAGLAKQLPIVEEAKLDNLCNLIGAAKVESLLGKLAEQLEGRFAEDERGAENLAILRREAHKLASSAGMLGFVQLSRSCANLEAELQAQEDFAPPLAEVRQACAEALAEISRRLNPARAPT